MKIQLVNHLEKVIIHWLESAELAQAVQKTLDARLFTDSDIRFTLEHLRDTISRGDLKTWVDRNRAYDPTKSGGTILCLHAGNLPLVGFQDALAVILSGYSYAGKISKKDPFLLVSFLEQLQKELHFDSRKIRYSTELSDFKGLGADYWMFAGAESSLLQIKSLLEQHRIVKPGAESLLRLAHFSIAVLDDTLTDLALQDLTESILRYDGKGCRSVALIYSRMPLSKQAGKLAKVGKEWLVKNGVSFNPPEHLKWKFAYNAAVGLEQVWIGNTLIQNGNPVIGHHQHVYWQSLNVLHEQLVVFGKGLQQMYTIGNGSGICPELVSDKYDLLSDAQKPKLYWQPDGTDTLKWILTR